MKHTLRLLTVLALIAVVSQPASAERFQKSIDVSPGERLVIDLDTGGSIDIRGWDESRVEVTAEVSDRKRGRFAVERTSGGVRIDTDLPWGKKPRGELEVRVPRVFDIKVHTMGGGVSIHGVEGKIEGITMGGALDFSDLRGEIKFETMGGNISLVDSEIDGAVKTMGGVVELRDVSGGVDGSSMGGNVIYKNVTRPNGDSTGDRVVISTMGGRIEVDEAPAGAELETMGGPIVVGSANEFVQAKTMGGAIRIDAVDGWADVTTMGGNVDLTMIGNPDSGRRDLNVESMGGQLNITVPAGLDMEIEIELSYTKRHQGKYSIQSDFPLALEETSEWSYKKHWGDPRKLIVGKATVGSGKHKIKLRTINGNIFLKKGAS